MKSYPVLVWNLSALLVIEMNELESWLSEMTDLSRGKWAFVFDMTERDPTHTFPKSFRSQNGSLASSCIGIYAKNTECHWWRCFGGMASLYVFASNIHTFGTGSEGHLSRVMSAKSLLGPWLMYMESNDNRRWGLSSVLTNIVSLDA